MKITKIIGREIFDSRGIPTVECMLTLEDERVVVASVPSGVSRGTHEAVELRDGGNRLMGQGVSKAIENIERSIAPILIDQEPDVIAMDMRMLELDGTSSKANLGANAMLATSIAVLKAQALVHEVEPYEFIAHLCGLESIRFPIPLFNVINGGMHANNNLMIQEFMLVPVDVPTFRAAMEAAVVAFHELKELLRKAGKSVAVGDEGGFAPTFDGGEKEVLDFLMKAIERAKAKINAQYVLALDVAATQLYDPEKQRYSWYDKQLTAEDLIKVYEKLSEEYPIYSIEDGLSEDDGEGWQLMMHLLGDKMQIVGDDLFATSCERILYGAEHALADAVVIKPNQIGTVTETLQAIKLCKEQDMNVIVSHRSGETNDVFIADLALGANATHIKAGGCSRGERLAKYNHLLCIEDALVSSALAI